MKFFTLFGAVPAQETYRLGLGPDGTPRLAVSSNSLLTKALSLN
jgi:hypothetical protein